MTRRFGAWVAALCALVAALVLGSGAALARTERFAVLIGNNAGAKSDVELRYAESDAAKVHDVLKDLGGFSPANMVLLRGEDADTVRRTLITMNDRIRASIATPDVQVIFFVYYSGHADATALRLGSTSLELSQIEQLARGSAATFRVLVVDACRSGTLTRVKGGTSAPPFAIRLDTRLAGQGMVLLTSSSANEDAQESDEIKGSFFTHYLVSGMLGTADADNDGAVVLEEAYRYAYDSTLRATSRTWAGTQHPTFSYDLRGQGKVVLTALRVNASRRALVELPPGRSWYLMQGLNAGPVVAEVGANDVTRTISLRPLTYFVRGRGKDHLLEGTIAPAAGTTYAVKEGELEKVQYARLVRKGQGVSALAHGPQAGYRFRTPLLNGSSLCHGFFVGYAFDLEPLSIVPRAGACRSSFTNEHVEGRSDELDLELRLAHAWDLPLSATFEVALAGGAALLHQSFETTGVAPDRNTLAGEVSLGAGLGFDLPAGFYLFADAEAQLYLYEQRTAEAPEGAFAPALAIRPSVGAGKRW